MTTIITRAGKGSPLTNNEMDANFTNLNKDKLESANPTTSGTLTHSGDIRLSGSGQRITGDFSNTTVINRVLFQTSTANSGTVVGVIPTTTGQYTGFQAYNTATPGSGNNAILDIGVVDGTDCRIQASYEASGPVLPLTFYTGGTERFRVSTSGAIGLSGGNYGTSGQVLTSQGSGTPPIWSTVAGGGVTSVNGNTGAVTAAQVAAAATAGYGYTPANPANVAPSTHSHNYAPMTAVVSIVKYEDTDKRYIRYTRANGAVVDALWTNIAAGGGE